MKKILTALLMCVSLGAMAASNEFVGPIENACKTTEQFNKFLRALCKQVPNKKRRMVCATGKIVAPDSMLPVFGRMTVVNHSDHFVITVPVAPGRMTWGAMNVLAIEHYGGHENGIFGFSLVLDTTSVAAAHASLKKAKIRLSYVEDEDVGDKVGVNIRKRENGAIEATCDYSN